MAKRLTLSHPGEILKRVYLDDMGIRPATLAKAIGVDRAAISKILAGTRDITADMSIRLGLFFEQSENFWLNMQQNYDMRKIRDERLAHYQKVIVPYQAPDHWAAP